LVAKQTTARRGNSRTIEIQLRRVRALDMKVAGGTDRSIAQALGVSPATANKDVKKALAELMAEYSETADELRAMLMRRYERLFLTHWGKATAGDVKATELCLAILQHERAIHGLDGPIKIVGEDGGPLQIELSIAQIAQAAAELQHVEEPEYRFVENEEPAEIPPV
jgi:DNA-binding CsgD family transcriptional regulator